MLLTTNLTSVSTQSITAAAGFSAHTVTLNVPVGPRYHTLWVKGNAGTGKKMIDLIGEIRVKLNDQVQRVHTAEELNKLNVLFGLEYAASGGLTAATDFALPIFFAEPWRKSIAAQEGNAWATGAQSVDSFQVEIDVKTYASATAGVTTLSFTAEYEESFYLADGTEVAADTVPIGLIEKVYATTIPSPGGGTDYGDFIQLPKREPISQITVFDYTNFVGFELRINNKVFREDTKTQNEYKLIARGMFPNPTKTATAFRVATDIPNSTDSTQRGCIDIVPDINDVTSALLPVVLNGKPINNLNLRLKTSTTAGTNLKCIYKTVGRPD